MSFEKLTEIAVENEIDGVILTSFPNVRYFTGVVIYTQILIPQRIASLVVPVEGDDPTLLVCNIEESLAKRESRIGDVRSYEEFNESPIVAIAEIVKEKGLQQAVIGIEESALTSLHVSELKRSLPNVKFKAIDEILDRIFSNFCIGK